MSDKGAGEASLREAVRLIGHRVAVSAGSFVALLALFHHVPVTTAVLRGGATYFACLLVARYGGLALAKAAAIDAAALDTTPEEEASS